MLGTVLLWTLRNAQEVSMMTSSTYCCGCREALLSRCKRIIGLRLEQAWAVWPVSPFMICVPRHCSLEDQAGV